MSRTAACTKGAHVRNEVGVEVEWGPYDGTEMRVSASSCAFCLPLYEYGMCGGRYRIRRTTFYRGGLRVHMTPANCLSRQVRAWWTALMGGNAI